MADVTRSEIEAWNANARYMTGLVLSTPAEELDLPVAGEWSPRQLLAHLLDSEIVFSTRLRAALSNPRATVLAFNRDELATAIPYQSVPIEFLGQAFLNLRATNSELLKALPASAWDLTIDHPALGLQQLPAIARVFGEHIASHISELKAMRSKQG